MGADGLLSGLRHRHWRRKYTRDDGDLVAGFYVPVLESAIRYDRLTGYFGASALLLAARGVEDLMRNDGRMRLVVGCTLDAEEVAAIERGSVLREQVERRLVSAPLEPPDRAASDALELLAWMLAQGYLDVKVAVPCDDRGRPVAQDGIFHEKSGIVEDAAGDRIAWTGSLNETFAGWTQNWESIHVFTSWGPDPERVKDEEANFAAIWADRYRPLKVMDVPEAVRRDLLRYLPESDRPARLRDVELEVRKRPPKAPPAPDPVPDARSRVWSFLAAAPSLSGGGARVGEATAAVTLWPHQVRAFERLYGNWPPRLLIADEVGLGKTIQAGMLLRQAWLAGRAKRVLILAPRAVLPQWQIELREKFNLNWPIYDGRHLDYCDSPALPDSQRREPGPRGWHAEPVVIASSQLMRRKERAAVLLEQAEPWDLVVLDEAHHARRRGAGTNRKDEPNALLRLMRKLKDRAAGLVLLTATPMQVAPVEVWDLLALLGLPPDWTAEAFLRFFEDAGSGNPSPNAMERLARLFRTVEARYGEVAPEEVQRLTGFGSALRARRVAKALRDSASIPRRRLDADERQAAVALMRARTPIFPLVSRHTRELLRRYHRKGMLETPIAEREVEDCFVTMTRDEAALYAAVEEYISTTFNQAAQEERNAVGFVMTVYRRRLASSFRALRATLGRHRDALAGGAESAVSLDEDISDDELSEEARDTDEAAELERRALAAEECAAIETLLDRARRLPPDSKVEALRRRLGELRDGGFRQAMVFTMFTDTMDFLREELARDGVFRLMCFSGRGGEVQSPDGVWRLVSRDEARRRFRDGEADLLLCTDAAAEGLNFQFCGALVNYDMPWNPMRVEQRIGRIDRLGQQYLTIRIVNLHYEGTVETDVYRVLRDRIGLFQSVVGPLQPILSRMPRTIRDAVLSRSQHREGGDGERLAARIEREVSEAEAGFDVDAAVDAEGPNLTMPERSPSPVTMDDLDRIIRSPELMPPGTEVKRLGRREYSLLAPGMPRAIRVTTDPAYYEQHSESVELWSPGNPLFRPPEFTGSDQVDFAPGITLADLLTKRT